MRQRFCNVVCIWDYKYFVVQTAQNKAELGSFRKTPLHCQQLLGFRPAGLVSWSFPWKNFAAGSAWQAAKDDVSVQLPVRWSGKPCFRPEWLTHSCCMWGFEKPAWYSWRCCSPRQEVWDLSQRFLNTLGNLERSQLTGSWQMLFQFSRRGRRMTLGTRDLSFLLQCLLKLWRKLFWELLKNTWRTTWSLVTASMASWGDSPVSPT